MISVIPDGLPLPLDCWSDVMIPKLKHTLDKVTRRKLWPFSFQEPFLQWPYVMVYNVLRVINRPHIERDLLTSAYYAFRSGTLPNLTSPLHRYLFGPDGSILTSVQQDYLVDLAESWNIKCLPMNRYRIYRTHMGKLVELLLAYALEKCGDVIMNLAALGGDIDIRARSRKRIATAYEVKYLGMSDQEFLVMIRSFRNDSVFMPIDSLSAANRIL